MRPLAVLVTGAPGSGKTTLGTRLGRELRVPFLARDDVRGGLFCTAGAWGDGPVAVPPAADADEAFLAMAEAFAARGISCVLEHAVRRTRPWVLDRLTAAADVVVVRTSCDGAMDRFVERAAQERLLSQPAVLAATGAASAEAHARASVERMQAVAEELLVEFDLPLLEVDTTDGYEPDLDAVVRFVTARR